MNKPGQIIESFDYRDRFELVRLLDQQDEDESWEVIELGTLRVGNQRFFLVNEDRPDWYPF